VLGIFMGVSTATRWPAVLEYFNRTPFGTKDPQFGLDSSFYVFELPFWHGVLGYASAVILVAGLAALATTYLYGGIRVSGREVRVARAARVQLAITAFVYVRLIVLMYFTEVPGDDEVVVVLTPSIGSTVAITAGVAATVVLGIVPSFLLEIASNASQFLL